MTSQPCSETTDSQIHESNREATTMSSTFARVSVARVSVARVSVARVGIAQNYVIRICEDNRAAMKEELRQFSKTFRIKQATHTTSDRQSDSAEQTADEIEMMDLEVPTDPKYELIKSLDIEAEKRRYVEKGEWSRAFERACRLQGLV